MIYHGTKYNASVRLRAALAALDKAKRRHAAEQDYCKRKSVSGGLGRLRIAERMLAKAEHRLSVACYCWAQACDNISPTILHTP